VANCRVPGAACADAAAVAAFLPLAMNVFIFFILRLLPFLRPFLREMILSRPHGIEIMRGVCHLRNLQWFRMIALMWDLRRLPLHEKSASSWVPLGSLQAQIRQKGPERLRIWVWDDPVRSETVRSSRHSFWACSHTRPTPRLKKAGARFPRTPAFKSNTMGASERPAIEVGCAAAATRRLRVLT